ncbi:MAG: sigma 54-interacting transcriptional regulator [Bacillota bacterium]
MEAANKIAREISGQVDATRLAGDREYLERLKKDVLEPAVVKFRDKEKMVVQVYFEMGPELTPQLAPEEEVIGVLISDVTKKGKYVFSERVRVKDFHPGNPYMYWYYHPVEQGHGIWTNVYFDHYINKNVISYNLPVYAQGSLVGVVGLDLDYEDFYKTMRLRLVENIRNQVAEIKKEHQIIGQEGHLAGHYISLDPLELVSKDEIFRDFITHSEQMEEVKNMIIKASLCTANILLLGETGVGKDFIASYIHSKSPVRNGPFININCSAIPENLLESEFFGYEKGAFTGAKSEGKPGYFELANKGTIFLNEIGEVPLHLQAKFLKVIQEKTVTRVGGINSKKIDFRLMAATNRNLLELVRLGKFREDLYYRLNVISIYIPPLRERKDDIVSFLNYFLHKNMEKYQVKRTFSSKVLEILVEYHWPGNIRELENVVERMVVTSDQPIIDVDTLPKEIMANDPESRKKELAYDSLKEMLQKYESTIIRNAFLELGSSYKVAKALKISQSQANYKIRKYLTPKP